MKIATFRWQGARHVGLVSADGSSVEPFALDAAQAELGALPLIAMQQRGMDTAAGETILALAVMSIILTAPTGAWAISAIGRRVLKVGPETTAYQAALESEG